MKPGTFEWAHDPAAGPEDQSSRNQRETGTGLEGGFTGVADEELEFFDTVGVEAPTATDAFSFAGVRIRH
jgi:hypothetical protein